MGNNDQRNTNTKLIKCSKSVTKIPKYFRLWQLKN